MTHTEILNVTKMWADFLNDLKCKLDFVTTKAKPPIEEDMSISEFKALINTWINEQQNLIAKLSKEIEFFNE